MVTGWQVRVTTLAASPMMVTGWQVRVTTLAANPMITGWQVRVTTLAAALMVTGWQVRVTTLAASPDGNWDQGTQIGCGYNGGENLYIFPDVGHCRPMCMCVLQVCVGNQSVWPQFVVSADSCTTW